MKTIKKVFSLLVILAISFQSFAQINQGNSTTIRPSDNSTFPTENDYNNVIKQMIKTKFSQNDISGLSFKNRENKTQSGVNMSLIPSLNNNSSLIIIKKNRSIYAFSGRTKGSETTFYDINNPNTPVFSLNGTGKKYSLSSSERSTRVSCAAAALAACQADPECNLNCSLAGQLCSAAIVIACWFK